MSVSQSFLESRQLKRFFVLAALAVAAPPVAAQKGKVKGEAARYAQLDAFVGQAIKEWKVPGVALAIVKDDSIVYAKGYGTRTVGKQEPVDANTITADLRDGVLTVVCPKISDGASHRIRIT